MGLPTLKKDWVRKSYFRGCHICGRSTNLRYYLSSLICGLRNLFDDHQPLTVCTHIETLRYSPSRNEWMPINWNSLRWGKKNILLLGRLEQPRQDKNLLFLSKKGPTNQQRIPFHLYSMSPHLHQFPQSAGDFPLLSLLSYSIPKREKRLPERDRRMRRFFVIMSNEDITHKNLEFLLCWSRARAWQKLKPLQIICKRNIRMGARNIKRKLRKFSVFFCHVQVYSAHSSNALNLIEE